MTIFNHELSLMKIQLYLSYPSKSTSPHSVTMSYQAIRIECSEAIFVEVSGFFKLGIKESCNMELLRLKTRRKK